MKYESVNFSKWPQRPSKEYFDEWQQVRKEKHNFKFTQIAINRMGIHLHKCFERGVGVDDAIGFAIANGWRGIQYGWVMKALQEELQALNDNIDPYRASGVFNNKETRQMSLTDEMDKGWAH